MGLYTHYKLNESSGTNAPDSSGNGRNGTLVNMEDPGDWVAGKLNNCLSFGGTDEYVNCSNIASFERTDKWSTEFWCKLPSGGQGTVVGRIDNSSPYRGWKVAVDAAGKVVFVLTNTSGTNEIVASENAVLVLDNAWHHCIVTYDGSSNTVGVKFYVDSTLRTTSGAPSTLSATTIVAKNCQIAGQDGPNVCITGLVDEVVIYDHELTQAEVTARWNGGSGTEEIALVPSAVDDDISITEDLTVIQVFPVNVDDDVSITEDVTISVSALCISVDDDISITEDVGEFQALEINVNDDIGISEDLTVIYGSLDINVDDDISISELYIAPPREIDGNTSFISKQVAIITP